MTNRRAHPVRAIVATVAIAAQFGSACAGDATPRTISGIRSEPAPSVSGLALPDGDGVETPLVPTVGDFLVVYFGYTACPDVCPTTMFELRTALAALGDDARRVEVAMITIDPARDTADVITRYVRGFVESGVALRTDDDTRLHAVADAFGASFSVTTEVDGTPKVSHTPNLYVVDRSGALVLTWPFGLPAAAIATDLEILLSVTESSS